MSEEGKRNQSQLSISGKGVNQVFALIWLGVSVVVFTQCRDLEYVAEYGPGPGFLPFRLGLGLVLLEFVLLSQYGFFPKKGEILLISNKLASIQMFPVMFCFSCWFEEIWMPKP